MKLLNRVSVILLLIIPAGILYSQSIKDVPDNFKKDLKEYLKNEEEKDEGEDAGGFQIDPSLYSKFQVPEFTYKQLQLGSDELLNFSKTGDDSNIGINFDGDYKYFEQSLYSTIQYSVQPAFDFVQAGDEDPFSALQLGIPFDISKYFNQQYSGMQGFTDGTFTISKVGEADLTNPLDLTIGAGYGRITSVRPIARAVALANRVGNYITEDDIIELANIITRQNDGYYVKKYKSDANIMYYNELSAALKAPDDVMRIQQVMEDPAFSYISDRKIGWQARAGYATTLLTDEETSGSLVVSADYAKPMGLDTQLIFGVELSQPEEGDAETSINGSYTKDHTVTWVSGATLAYNSSSTDIELSTTKILINKITGRAALTLSQPETGDMSINFVITFNYFVF